MNFKESFKNFLNKIPAFFSGFLLGVVLTGAFFLFKINEYIIQLKNTWYPKITVIEKKEEPNSKQHQPKKYKNNQKATNHQTTEYTSDSTITEIQEHTSVIEEKIISEKKVRIIHLDTSADSTLTELADVPSFIKDNEIKIVFKKTPFNNKGYYFEDNHLVLFGLEDIPYINVYEYKGELFIKYDKLVFKLPNTNHFQNLIKVEDEYLLAKMN